MDIVDVLKKLSDGFEELLPQVEGTASYQSLVGVRSVIAKVHDEIVANRIADAEEQRIVNLWTMRGYDDGGVGREDLSLTDEVPAGYKAAYSGGYANARARSN